ncbi:MAG: hypothetical protein DCC58_12460 [Chloroflexi bacterium]|nr:MAG: hypothetical protein DCC58_12460 [Chloroflexota bacterium]
MYTIIVPLDGSEFAEHAIGLGQLLAETLGGVLELVTVLEEPVLLDLTPGVVLPNRLAAERYLNSIAEKLETTAECRTTVLRGVPVDEILSIAAAQEDTIIAMSTHGRSGVARFTFGSVADKITRGASCPVALVRGTVDTVSWKVRKALVPLDGSEFGESAIPLAQALADGDGGEIHLLRVVPAFWSAPYVAYGPEAMYLNADQIAELTEEAQQEARAYLEEMATVARAAGARVTWEVRVGRAADEIIRVAETVEPDIIVLSSHGRGGFRRWALGSVADEVLHRSTTPILVVPPKAASQVELRSVKTHAAGQHG